MLILLTSSDTAALYLTFQTEYGNCIGMYRDSMFGLLGEVEVRLKASSGDDAARFVEQCLCIGRAAHCVAVKVQALHYLVFGDGGKTRKSGSQTGMFVVFMVRSEGFGIPECGVGML